MEFLWTTMMVILIQRLIMVIRFHDNLHGFHTGKDTGTASLEANMLQDPMDMREEVIYEIFLDIHKAYVSLDCSRCL